MAGPPRREHKGQTCSGAVRGQAARGSSRKPGRAAEPTEPGTAVAVPSRQVQVEVAEIQPLEGRAININILLAQVTRDTAPEKALENAHRALELAKKWEDHHLQVFKQRAEATIQFKERDPDEREKRKNNGVRRSLKMVIAACGVAGVGGMLTLGSVGGNMVVATLSGLVGAVCLASLAPLAAGESVSAAEIVNIINAFVAGLRHDDSTKSTRVERQEQARKGGKR